MSSERQYIDLYRQQRELICSHSVGPMNAVRDAAFAQFCRQGFPSKKVERYKYTDIDRLMAPDYGLNLQRLNIPADPYKAFRCDVPNLSTNLFFVLNDAFCDSTVPNAHLPEGVIVGSLAKNAYSIENYYDRLASGSADAITCLNTMLAQDGMLVYVPRGVKVEKAVQVINILKAPPFLERAGGNGLMVNRRVLVVAEEGAEVTLLFCDHTADDRQFLTTQVIEVYAHARAHVNLYCMEETHAKNVRISNAYMKLGSQARVTHNVITLHNGVTRNMLDVMLAGDGAECESLGCVIADKQQHVDNNTLIIHRAERCTSNELYKYVLEGNATGAFAGRVLVEPGAQKTTSQMTNQNLCASADARMYTQPMLEIYADDVKCAHGSTVGQLNDAALFYMRQRGIPELEARTLLEVAFINQVIDQITLVPLRDRLHYLVEKRFRGELNKCDGCQLCH
mgnify:CR=1 FL=1